MDWLVRMNAVLDYIEDNLTGNIDYDVIAKVSLSSGDLFQRMFSNFTGISLSEYIRRRRLSSAAILLSKGNYSVIDVAFVYGYESPDSFSYAFKKLHGVTPLQAKNQGVVLKSYSKLSFQVHMKGGNEMKYRIVEKEAFKVIGSKIVTSQEENMKKNAIPKFWDKVNADGSAEKMCTFSKEQSVLGVCYDGKPDGTFSYMIGVVSDKTSPDFEVITIPSAKWAVFECIGPMPKSIQKVWNDIFQNFLPTSGYEHAPMADFELYTYGDVKSPDYKSEVWIPIVPKKNK